MSAPARTAGFLRDLSDQLRAGDTYGRFDRFSDEHLLGPFVVDSARRLEIPVGCDMDPATEARVRSFYQAVAAGAERVSGVMTSTVLDISHEGFGRVVVFAGRLVVVVESLRDAQRFGFPSLEALDERGQRLVAQAVATIEIHPEVARDES